MVVYKTTNTINGKIYVGKDCGRNPGYLGSGTLLRKAITKHGKENFKKEILEVCDLSNICEREVWWISTLKSRDSSIGYNICIGGRKGMQGLKASEETRKKMSASSRHKGPLIKGMKMPRLWVEKSAKARMGHVVSEETRERISIANKGRKPTAKTIEASLKKRLGKPLSDEQKQKLSIAFKGRVFSDEWKRKISEAKLGKKLSKEHCEKISLCHKGLKYPNRRPYSEEARRNMSLAHKKKSIMAEGL